MSAGGVGRQGLCSKLALAARYDGLPVTDADDLCEEWVERGFYEGEDGAIHAERRSAVRTPVECPARLQTPSCDWSARLADISQRGARLRLSNPPRAGVSALLKWSVNEVFCVVAWANKDACGVSFERPIAREIVLETIGENFEATVPAADLSKIRPGVRRMRRQAWV
jgi:hypothetical protein